MTDSCATCRYYVSGECVRDPPQAGATGTVARRPPPTYWCGEFSAGSSGGVVQYASIAAAANSTNTFLWLLKVDGTLWLSLNNGSTWAQVTGP